MPSQTKDRAEIAEILLAELPEADAVFLRAFYLEGFSHAELGKRFQMSLKAAESRLARLRKKLRRLVDTAPGQKNLPSLVP